MIPPMKNYIYLEHSVSLGMVCFQGQLLVWGDCLFLQIYTVMLSCNFYLHQPKLMNPQRSRHALLPVVLRFCRENSPGQVGQGSCSNSLTTSILGLHVAAIPKKDVTCVGCGPLPVIVANEGL